MVAEVDRAAAVEDVERSLPQAVVAEALAVAHDAAVELVDLAEAAAHHEAREHFAADAAGAVGDDGPALQLVVPARVEFGHEVACALDIGHDRAPESADRRLERIASVEEHDLVAALGDEVVQGVGTQLRAAADHAGLVDGELTGRAEAHDLLAHLDAELREVGARTARVEPRALAPLEVDVLERGVVAGLPNVALQRTELPAEGAVETVLRDEDAPAQPERFGEVALPQPHGVGVGERRECVVEEDLGDGHPGIVRARSGAAHGGASA